MRWLHSITDSVDMNLGELQDIVENRGIMGFQRVGRKLVTEQKQLIRKGKVRQHERS